MRIFPAIFTAFLLVTAALAQTESRVTLPPPGYRLAWSDEFDGGQLDTNKWEYRTDSKMWSTQKPENVSLRGGKLVLAVKQEEAGDKHYTGAGIISRQAFKFGYYEARFKVPPGAGWHTSFWMMLHSGDGGTGPAEAAQELDVCENDSVNPTNYAVNVHKWNPPPHVSHGHRTVKTPDLSSDFHVFGCEFTKAFVKYYFEGRLVQTVAATNFTPGDQNIWLTTIASNLGGTRRVDDTKLPAAAEFDYVRFYEPTNGDADAEMDLGSMIQPVPATAKWADPNFNIWCGSQIKGEDGKYHLFYSRWPRALGHLAWVTHSEVAHAVGDSPFGPWTHRDVALPARGTNYWDGSCTHNPTIIRVGKLYYLYYMGNYGDGVLNATLNWTHRNHQRIGLAVAESPDGPWRRFDRPILDASQDTNAPDALLVSNPSVALRPDGGVLMVYKAVAMKDPLPFGGPVSLLIATADNPAGPFTKHPGEVFGAKGVKFAAEDPFIWRGVDRYWAVVKDNSGNFTHQGYSLALWESADGFVWKLAQHPFVANPESIHWENGHPDKLTALERPQLVIENGQPIALGCAAADNQNREGSFNVQIPLKPANPSSAQTGIKSR